MNVLAITFLLVLILVSFASKQMNFDFIRFNLNLFLQNQTYTLFKIVVTSQYKAYIVGLDISIAVSLAKLINSVLYI